MEQNKLGILLMIIAIVSLLKFVDPLGKNHFLSVPWDLKYKRIKIIRPQNLSFTHSELFNDN